jgi:hypothetical protein
VTDGKGRKRGPTLLEPHNDTSAAITSSLRSRKSLDVIGLDDIEIVATNLTRTDWRS